MMMLHQLLSAVVRLLICTLPFWIIFRIYMLRYRKKPGRTALHEVLLFLGYVYVTCVIALTLYPLPLAKNSSMFVVNLIPFVYTTQELYNALRYKHWITVGHSLINIVGNIILFLPLGVLLPLLLPALHTFKKIVLTAFLASFTIELLQYLSHFAGNYRNTDVDDVILNTLGAVTGYGLYKLSRLMLPAKKQSPSRKEPH